MSTLFGQPDSGNASTQPLSGRVFWIFLGEALRQRLVPYTSYDDEYHGAKNRRWGSSSSLESGSNGAAAGHLVACSSTYLPVKSTFN
ncbi:MAG TPA: hypothetical protein VFP71_15195 [Candidatus Angelobacter sp.]|nr:hypothetical protein [Candidatus Angelobacter sp.]